MCDFEPLVSTGFKLDLLSVPVQVFEVFSLVCDRKYVPSIWSFFEIENVSSNNEDWSGRPGHNVNTNPIMNANVAFIFSFINSEWLSWFSCFSLGYQVFVLHSYNVLSHIYFQPLCAAILILILSFGVEGSLLNSYPKFKNLTLS